MHKLSTWNIAKKNLRRHPYRNFCLITAILLLSLFLFVGSVLSLSLSNGAESMSNRLGADVMVVPEGYDPHVDSILLAGKPSTFYLPENAMEEILKIKNDLGIKLISPQIFLATLNASCCSYPIQLVGIDYESDFIIGSWLKNEIYHDLSDGEIIVGYHVSGWPGDIIKFFNQDLKVAARLEQTGMGFDAMIFMNRATIEKLAIEAEKILGRPFGNKKNSASVLMLKLEQGYDSVAAASEINRQLNKKGIYALFSKKFVNNIGSSLKMISFIIKSCVIFLWLLSIFIVGLIFALTLSERKKEFGVLRSIGASRKKLIALCFAEVFLISFYGALLGVILGNAAVAVGSPLAKDALHLPFLLPPIGTILKFSAFSIIAAIFTGIFSASISVFRAARADIHEILKSN
ncbi:MAG: FtsX-like permease family protein [Synergistaceae bacterium]|nr:FtsX-like permease family protein [Synergistaceae bacterium]